MIPRIKDHSGHGATMRYLHTTPPAGSAYIQQELQRWLGQESLANKRAARCDHAQPGHVAVYHRRPKLRAQEREIFNIGNSIHRRGKRKCVNTGSPRISIAPHHDHIRKPVTKSFKHHAFTLSEQYGLIIDHYRIGRPLRPNRYFANLLRRWCCAVKVRDSTDRRRHIRRRGSHPHATWHITADVHVPANHRRVICGELLHGKGSRTACFQHFGRRYNFRPHRVGIKSRTAPSLRETQRDETSPELSLIIVESTLQNFPMVRRGKSNTLREATFDTHLTRPLAPRRGQVSSVSTHPNFSSQCRPRL